jgi:hypothetical protein
VSAQIENTCYSKLWVADLFHLPVRSKHQLMSLASRIKAIQHAMTAEELADLLCVRVYRFFDEQSAELSRHSVSDRV